MVLASLAAIGVVKILGFREQGIECFSLSKEGIAAGRCRALVSFSNTEWRRRSRKNLYILLSDMFVPGVFVHGPLAPLGPIQNITVSPNGCWERPNERQWSLSRNYKRGSRGLIAHNGRRRESHTGVRLVEAVIYVVDRRWNGGSMLRIGTLLDRSGCRVSECSSAAGQKQLTCVRMQQAANL